jgi:hypothetical protein
VERLFTNAWNLAALSDILSADGVTIELIQHSTTRAGKGFELRLNAVVKIEDFRGVPNPPQG